MRKLIILMLLSFSIGVYAQNAPIDFEAGGNGAGWTWAVFENDTNPPLEIIANPDPTGNTSATVAKFTALQAGQPFAGTESMKGSDIGSFTLDNTNSIIKVWVWKPVISDVGVKLVQPDFAALPEVKVANTVVNQWEQLTFDFSGQEGFLYDQIVVFPDFQARTSDNICYFDEITFNAQPVTGPNVPIDFEAGGNGADWTWSVFENDTNPPLEIIPNPDPTGNTSATVAKFTALQAGQPFAGVESMKGADIGSFMLDSTTSTIKIMVWKSVISDVGIKLVQPDFGALPEVKVANTVVNQWEELTFDMSDREGILYDQIVVFPDFNARTSDNIVYFDNISFNGPAGATPTAAPTPTASPANVISLFSNAYTDVPVDTWRTPWSSATLVDIQIDGNDTKLYTDLDFVGVETVGPNLVDASGMTHFNIDIWTPNATTFRIKLVDFGADMAFGGGDDSEFEIPFTGFPQQQWVTFSVPLSDFTGLTSTSNLAQYIFSAIPVGTSTVYVDNVYFDAQPIAGPNVPIDFEAGGNGADWTWTVFENDTNPPLEIIPNPDPTGNTSATVAKFTALQAGQPFAGVESMKGADIGAFTLDNTNSLIKIWVWKPVISDVGIKLVQPDFAALPEVKVANTVVNQWEQLTFDFSGQEGFLYDQIVVFPDFDARTSDNICYFDNITLNAQTVTGPNVPIDFEVGGNGADWTWTVFENDTNPPLEIIPNPDPTGNTSATVAKFTALQAGQPFAGVESMKGADIGQFTLDNTNSLIKIWVWKPVISDVGIKLVQPDFAALPEVKVANTVVNQWEQLTFDFSGQEGFLYDQIVIFPDFDARTSDNICYFDNITLNQQVVVGPNVPIDFEAGGNGADWTWTVFENDTNPPLEIIPNPDPTGNTSATVAKFTALQTGQPFAGVESMKGADIGQFTLDNTNSVIKIWVWKPVISDVGIKLVQPDFAALPEVKVANTVVNQWEQLTFDFSGQEGFLYDQIVIFPDFNARTSDNICYFDNITLNPQATCPAPTGLTSTVTDDDVLLSWNAVPGASGYVIRGGTVASTNPVNIPVGAGTTSYMVNNLAENNYTWTVKAICSINPVDESMFAPADFFSIVPPPFCPAPTGPTTVVNGTSATVSWTASNNAIGYYVLGGPISNPGAVGIIVTNPNDNSVTVNNLAPGVYTWKVRSGCAVNPQVLSPFSPSDVFTVVNPSAKLGAGVFGDAGNGSINVEMFPNPASSQVNFIVRDMDNEELTIELYDISGRMMDMTNTTVGQSQTITMNTSDLSNGMYQVVISSSTATRVERLIIAK